MTIRTDDNGIMKRPTYTDECVRRRAAEMLLPEVKGWLGTFASDEDITHDLMTTMTQAGGYEFAKSLDDRGWSVDARLVEILDNDTLNDACNEMVAKWVQCLDVKLAFEVGAEVIYRKKRGTVISRDEKLAKYAVYTEDLKPGWTLQCDAEDVSLASGVN